MRAFSTLSILPKSGRIACERRSRPCLADPPAESPSTMYSSLRSGSRSWQSASLPGSAEPSSALLRMTRSRALRAASRARAAVSDLSMMRRASPGFSSRYWPMPSPTAVCTWPLTSALPSLALVWPSNCGSVSLTLTTAVRPSRTSSPERLLFLSLMRPWRRAQSLSEVVSAARNPVTWVPPSTVLILLAKARTDSLNPSLYWIATSIWVGPSFLSADMGCRLSTSLPLLRCRTKLTRPPSK